MGKLDKKIVVDGIIENLRKYGNFKQCIIGVNCSLQTVKNARNPESPYYRPEFAKKVDEALQYYAKTNQHPSQNPKTRQTALEQFNAGVSAGRSSITKFEYLPDGKVDRKLHQKPGLEKWVMEMIWPPPTYSEKAVLDVTGNQLNDLMHGSYTEEERMFLLRWLTNWIQQAKIELQRQGVSTRLLDGIDKA